MTRRRHVISIGVLFCALLPMAEVLGESCDAWVQRAVSGPSARTGYVLSYHPEESNLVLFGGFNGVSLLDDTWVWGCTFWTEVSLAGAEPSAREGAAMSEAPAHLGDVLLFGGEDAGGLRNDTWKWNGTNWSPFTIPGPPHTPPPPARDAAMAYRRTPTLHGVLFGGFGAGNTAFDETYLWSADRWIFTGAFVRPPARGAHAMAHDPTRDEMVMFGGMTGDGETLGDTWVYKHLPAEWEPRTPLNSPSPRAFHSMAWDSDRQRVVLHGGEANGVVLNDTWEYDGYTWTQRPMPTGPSDPARSRADMAYDVVRQEMILFSGFDGTFRQPHTFARVFTEPPVMTAHPDSLVLSVGDEAEFEVSATGDSLTYRWRHGGVPLNNGGGISGATTDTLTISPIAANHFGLYDVVVTSGCASVASDPAGLYEAGILFGDHLNPPDQSADAPDDGFVDANGDGIDGMRVGPIFVSTVGSDKNLGTIEHPMRTIGAALLAAKSRTPVRDVYVSGGDYPETLTLIAGVNIYGGYDATNNWARSDAAASRPRINGGSVAVWAKGLNQATTLDRIEIQGADNFVPGAHAVGLLSWNNSGALTLSHCVVRSGDNRIAGKTGAKGADNSNRGGRGGDGGPGACDDTIAGGTGGTSGAAGIGATTGYNGGRGGTGGPHTQIKGEDGIDGKRNHVNVTNGGGGGFRCSVGNPGSVGDPGNQGTKGSHGSGATSFYGTGGAGSQGKTGDGGGGGGGGGGQINNNVAPGACQCILCVGGSGNGGGGGGGGGAGGFGAGGGRPGGSSFGLLILSTPNFTINDSAVTAGDGGPGGAGGQGGTGSEGGDGGLGATTCTSEVGAGGNGGKGGRGGTGGRGGGGRGGHSFGAFVEIGGSLNDTATTFTAGAPGAGGDSDPGGEGAPGEAAPTKILTAGTPLPGNIAPTAAYAFMMTAQDTPAPPVTPSIASANPLDPIDFSIASDAPNGTAGVAGNQLTYEPDPGFFGVDSFTFVAAETGDGYVIEGCAVVVVAPATPLVASHAEPICENSTLQLFATVIPNALYSWTGPTGYAAGGAMPTRVSMTPADSGTYRVGALVNGLPVSPEETNVAVIPVPEFPSRLYVAPGGFGGGCSDGDSWENALPELQEAMQRARVSNGATTEIWVAAGTYNPGAAPLDTFELIDGVTMYGGFAGNETDPSQRDIDSNATILSGASGVGNNIHVMVCPGGSPGLDGFTIRDGLANGFQFESTGAGLHILAGTPRLSRCKFFNNAGRFGSGAIHVPRNEGVELFDCVFDGNSAPESVGGAIRCAGTIDAVNCVFQNNSAKVGGALFFGSGARQSTFVNCLFVRNQSSNNGGNALRITGGSRIKVDLINCTVTLNDTVASGFGAIFVDDDAGLNVYNTIIWDNDNESVEDDQILDGGGIVMVSHSIISGLASYNGNNNSGEDPLFVDAMSDFHLTSNSPAKNSGDNTLLPSGTDSDLDGGPRVISGTVDRGAYEFVPVQPGDCDRDGDVDMRDVALFDACANGPEMPIDSSCIDKDFDEDGDIDQSDFGVLQRCISGENLPGDPSCAD